MNRKSPGPGAYNHAHLSDFYFADVSPNDVHLLKQRNFSTGPRDIPTFKKTKGVGDSTMLVDPHSYHVDSYLKEVQDKQRKEINKVVAVKQWHNRLLEDDKKKDPKKFARFLVNEKKSPGPMEYMHERAKPFVGRKDFQSAARAIAFGKDESRKIVEPDKVQMPGIMNPGPGDYIHPEEAKKAQHYTSNMTSKTQRNLHGQPLYTEKNPSPNAYKSEKFKSIEHPFISGGAPNNPTSLVKFEQALLEKHSNPFVPGVGHGIAYSAKDKLDRETANLGPGMYSPQGSQEIGGSFLEREKRAFKQHRNSDFSQAKSSTDISSLQQASNLEAAGPINSSSTLPGMNSGANLGFEVSSHRFG